jgi:hypothetical protein
VVGKKLTNKECSVTGCIVVVENPILHAPQIQSLSPNVLPQTPQNFAVKLYVDGLALGDKFEMSCSSFSPSSVMEMMGSSIAMTATLSQGHTRRPKTRHQ